MAASGLRFGGRGVNFGKTLAVAVTVLIVSVLVMLETPSQQAEAAALDLTLNQLRAALVVKGAEIRLADPKADYTNWTGLNPMDLLDRPVRNYDGPCTAAQPDTGRWCFDTKRYPGQLRYTPSQPITLEKGNVGRAEMRAWQVQPTFTDLNGNGRLDDADRQTGLKLVLMDSTNESDPNGRP